MNVDSGKTKLLPEIYSNNSNGMKVMETPPDLSFSDRQELPIGELNGAQASSMIDMLLEMNPHVTFSHHATDNDLVDKIRHQFN